MKKVPLLFAFLLSACTSGEMRDLHTKNEFAPSNSNSSRATANINYRGAPPRALAAYTARLQAEGRDARRHGVYVESLETGEPVATLNEDIAFNPASVIKLATTLAALERLGPDQKFHTDFLSTGEIDRAAGRLSSDLILFSGRDPAFLISDAKRVGEALGTLGIRQVNGGLIVVGNFNCNFKSDTTESAEIFLKHCGIEFRDPVRLEPDGNPRGRLLVSVESDSLLHIVQYLNAHSVNSIADLLAAHIGGTEDIKRILVDRAGLAPETVRISRGSGL